MESIYVQYGCGFSAPKGWYNFDSSLTLLYEKVPIIGKVYKKNEMRFPKNVIYGDIIKGLPGIKENSCDGVFCSHVLEHLTIKQVKIALKNTYKMLKRNGIFRLVVPDLFMRAKMYLELYMNNDLNSNIIF